jgi:hypothetical protein
VSSEFAATLNIFVGFTCESSTLLVTVQAWQIDSDIPRCRSAGSLQKNRGDCEIACEHRIRPIWKLRK